LYKELNDLNLRKITNKITTKTTKSQTTMEKSRKNGKETLDF